MRIKTRLPWIVLLCLPSFFMPCTAADDGPVLIKDVPHIKQKPDFCGEACVAMVLKKLGHPGDQDWVFDQSGLDPLLGRGCWTRELAQAVRNIGFASTKVWHGVEAEKSSKQLSELWGQVLAHLKKGVPCIACTRYSDKPKTTEHFRLVVGYDPKKDAVIYHEPAQRNGGYKKMARALFLKLWPLKYTKDRWTVIYIPLKPRSLKKGAPAATFTDADYAQHMMQLKKKIPPAGFTCILEKPFFVIGDETPAMVKRRAEKTVRWSVAHLKKLYFKKDPDTIIDIWLFKDKASYRKHTKSIFNDNPTTPYGYFSSSDNALIMNIYTGGGTLVHEIVHPFVAANFPACPSWLNEGLASLYEQCGERSGRMTGFTNWRLAGLKAAIKKGGLRSFKDLTATTTHQFYNSRSGTNYAQARYLCYYLQEKGLLVKYYQRFRKNCRTDPTGYETLKKVLAEKDMAAFQKGWEKWVMALSFP